MLADLHITTCGDTQHASLAAARHRREGALPVQRLGDDLDTAREFLEQAQRQVNRDIAPRLAAAIGGRLGRVTSGRYTGVRVNPTDLEVSVRTPEAGWRPARSLSEGTAEQIYLLCRIAMAEILVDPRESCPLLLDDVLVQCDPVRGLALLEVLREIAAKHQVILFSQEDDVRR
jgi:uncharacterized protein YhaN